MRALFPRLAPEGPPGAVCTWGSGARGGARAETPMPGVFDDASGGESRPSTTDGAPGWCPRAHTHTRAHKHTHTHTHTHTRARTHTHTHTKKTCK